MKKWLALFLIFAMALSMAACGNTQTEPAATEMTEAEVPPTEYLPYEGETLTVLYLSGAHADSARAMAPEFEAVTGAKVEVVDLSYEELYEEATLDLVSYIGNYDVINIDSQWDGEFAPYLVPLDDYIARDKYDMSVWIDNVLSNCGKWQETIVGIPTSCMAQLFAYRTDLLPNGLPTTWAEYRRILLSVNKPATGVYAIAVSRAPDQLMDMYTRVLWSMGGSWADENWNVSIVNTFGRSVLTHMHTIKTMSDPACTGWTTEDAIQAFLEGKAAVCEAWAIPDIIYRADDPDQSQIVGNWALARIPQDKTGISPMSAWDAAIPVGTANKKLAWEWIKMYTSEDMQNKFYDEFSIFSPRKEFWEQEKLADFAMVREALETANNAWRIPVLREAEANIASTFESYFSNMIYQDTAIRRMEAEVKRILEGMAIEEGIKNYNH